MLQLGGKLTEEQRIEKAVVQIMHKQPAIGGLVMLGKRVVCDKTRTACTDGRDEWYGREFVRGLNDKQLRFLILHEMYHKMYRHLITWRHLWKKCSNTANRAMDYEINIKILDEYKEFVEWIEGGCLNEAYRGWGTAKIFDDIYKMRTRSGRSISQMDFVSVINAGNTPGANVEPDVSGAIINSPMVSLNVDGKYTFCAMNLRLGLRHVELSLPAQVAMKNSRNGSLQSTLGCNNSSMSRLPPLPVLPATMLP